MAEAVAIQEEIAVTAINKRVKPVIESRYGSTKICAPMPKIMPPMIAPRNRSTCFWRDEPMVESAVMIQVAMRSTEPRPVNRRVDDVTGHGRERAAQGKLHVGGVGKRVMGEKVRGSLFVQRRWQELPDLRRTRKCLRYERDSPLHLRQKRQLRRLLLRPLNLCRRSPQHQIFGDDFNLVCQTLAAGLVGRVDVPGEAIRFRRLRAAR